MISIGLWMNLHFPFKVDVARAGLPFSCPCSDPEQGQWDVFLHTALLAVGLQEEYSLENGLVPEM